MTRHLFLRINISCAGTLIKKPSYRAFQCSYARLAYTGIPFNALTQDLCNISHIASQQVHLIILISAAVFILILNGKELMFTPLLYALPNTILLKVA